MGNHPPAMNVNPDEECELCRRVLHPGTPREGGLVSL